MKNLRSVTENRPYLELYVKKREEQGQNLKLCKFSSQAKMENFEDLFSIVF